jgi:predicted MPP superfamily phosphohydrolase
MPFLKYILILTFLLLLPAIYIYKYYVSVSKAKRSIKFCFWIPILLIIAALLLFMFHPMRMGLLYVRISFIFIFLVIFGNLSFSIVSFIGRLIGRHSRSVRKVFDYLAIFCCIVTIGIVLYSFQYGYKRLCVREVTVYSSDLPKAFDGYRIVQFSDLHIGSFSVGSNDVNNIVEKINAQKGDMIVFTGDLINIEASELDGYQSLLSRLKAHDGVYSVLGNHDYGKYKRWRTSADEARNLISLKQRERSYGWRLLLNEDTLIHRGDTCIALLGTEDYGTKIPYQYGDIKKAMASLPDGGKGLFKVHLTHDPSYWRIRILHQTDVQLTLSGHTHGMQLEIGSFSPCQWFFKEWNGLYTEGKQALFVSTGIGALIPYRYGAWPEVVAITLKRK